MSSKNYAAIYNSPNDSIALEQKFFIKEESIRGVLTPPTGADFIFTLNGASVNFTQPIESSPHKSGRHHTSIIKQKTSTEWSIPTFVNINTTLGSAGVAEIDPGMRVLYKSLLGKEDVTGGSPVYTSGEAPSITFSIFEIGDLWSKQAPGAFVESGNASFPGDGQSQIEWAGMAKTSLLVGMGKSIANNNDDNTFTVAASEGKRFPVGAQVMIIKADGTTRSTDTPDGSPHTVESVAGDVVTLSGPTLADADGSVNPVYLVYYEPVSAIAINDPQTGLQGSITIAGLSSADCVRSATINMTNSHEPQDFCFGEEGLGGRLFTPGNRFTVEVSLELSLSHELVEFLNNLKTFEGDDITLVLGDSAGRHLEMLVPKAIFPIPEISVPDTGTIPVTFTGNAYQTSLDLADEVTVSFL
jgi:hypothetical protein